MDRTDLTTISNASLRRCHVSLHKTGFFFDDGPCQSSVVDNELPRGVLHCRVVELCEQVLSGIFAVFAERLMNNLWRLEYCQQIDSVLEAGFHLEKSREVCAARDAYPASKSHLDFV